MPDPETVHSFAVQLKTCTHRCNRVASDIAWLEQVDWHETTWNCVEEKTSIWGGWRVVPLGLRATGNVDASEEGDVEDAL